MIFASQGLIRTGGIPIDMRRIAPFTKTLLCMFTIANVITQSGCKGDLATTPEVGPVWRVFTTSNSELRSNAINALASEPGGLIWIATDFGGYYYSTRSHSWGNFSESLYVWMYYPGETKIRKVTSVTYAKDQSIWFGFPTGALIRYSPYGFTANGPWRRIYDLVSTNSEISSLDALRTDWSGAGEVWAGTTEGVRRFIQSDASGSGTWVSYTNIIYANDQILCTRINPANSTVWFGTNNADGIFQAQYDPRFLFSYTNFPQGTKSPVNGMAFDGDTTVWFAQSLGIHKYNIPKMTWSYFTYQSTRGRIPPVEIRTAETLDQNLHWFGTDAGLLKLADTTWSSYTTANSPLPDDRVTCLRYDSFGNLWIGTKGGIAVYNPSGTRL